MSPASCIPALVPTGRRPRSLSSSRPSKPLLMHHFAVLVLAIAGLGLAAGMPGPAQAQGQNVPNALQGFARNRNEPVRINANSLEVRDKDKVAVFSGNVVVVQGDTTMQSKDLLVYYEGSVAPGASGEKDGAPAPGGAASGAPQQGEPVKSGQIRKLEATGGVLVKTKEQTASGDTGVFEMKTNTVTLVGKPVVLTQGPNVIRGQRLVVDLISGVSRFEGGRVESLIVPGSLKDQSKDPPKDQPRR